jgi:O-antigen/teichoic acid export membrane protein
VSASWEGGYLQGVEGKPLAGRDRRTRRARPFDATAAVLSAQARGETLQQLLDRNLAELLQELRVAITGVQILFAFLLGLAFTQRFTQLDAFEVGVYTVALLSTALATLVLIAPVSFHRLVFRRRQKAALVAVADRLLLAGLGLLVLAISAATLLVLDVVLGPWPGAVGGGLVFLAGLLTWYALPLWARRAGVGQAPALPEEGDVREG